MLICVHTYVWMHVKCNINNLGIIPRIDDQPTQFSKWMQSFEPLSTAFFSVYWGQWHMFWQIRTHITRMQQMCNNLTSSRLFRPALLKAQLSEEDIEEICHVTRCPGAPLVSFWRSVCVDDDVKWLIISLLSVLKKLGINHWVSQVYIHVLGSTYMY